MWEQQHVYNANTGLYEVKWVFNPNAKMVLVPKK